jgi:hypothetical protein
MYSVAFDDGLVETGVAAPCLQPHQLAGEWNSDFEKKMQEDAIEQVNARKRRSLRTHEALSEWGLANEIASHIRSFAMDELPVFFGRSVTTSLGHLITNTIYVWGVQKSPSGHAFAILHEPEAARAGSSGAANRPYEIAIFERRGQTAHLKATVELPCEEGSDIEPTLHIEYLIHPTAPILVSNRCTLST